MVPHIRLTIRDDEVSRLVADLQAHWTTESGTPDNEDWQRRLEALQQYTSERRLSTLADRAEDHGARRVSFGRIALHPPSPPREGVERLAQDSGALVDVTLSFWSLAGLLAFLRVARPLIVEWIRNRSITLDINDRKIHVANARDLNRAIEAVERLQRPPDKPASGATQQPDIESDIELLREVMREKLADHPPETERGD